MIKRSIKFNITQQIQNIISHFTIIKEFLIYYCNKTKKIFAFILERWYHYVEFGRYYKYKG